MFDHTLNSEFGTFGKDSQNGKLTKIYECIKMLHSNCKLTSTKDGYKWKSLLRWQSFITACVMI